MNPAKKYHTLKPLPNEIRSVVRSGITINTVAQCVEELVYNSIDAGAKNIHVGVNLELFNVRVEDDGNGLDETELEAVGVRYTTSKCSSLEDLNKIQSYGFRGEALASIIEVSNTVDIISRPKATVGIELKKKFEDGVKKGFVEKYNTSAKKSGTIVIVGKLLSKLPVRQQRIDKSIQLEEVKCSLEPIALINPDLNIEIRNERNGTALFTFKPSSCYSDAINQLFMSRIGFEVKFVQEHFLHKKFFFSLSVSFDFVKKKHYQFVFINNRFIRRCKIHKWIGNFILDRRKDSGSPKSDKYPIFILNITCPFGEYDITLEPKKQVVEFKEWDAIYSGIDGLILKLKHKNSLAHVGNKAESKDKNNASLISSYDVKGALHSRFAAREVDESSPKSSCTDSDRESSSRNCFPKAETKTTTRNRNLIRSSHNTHVVNVRELRKKRKLENPVAAKALPVPLKHKLSPAAYKPKLTLGTFKRFPEWAGEFEATAAPSAPKRSKDSHNQENYKFYVPNVPSDERHNQVELQNQNVSSNFSWKINRYFENYKQEDANVTTDGIRSAAEDEDMHIQELSNDIEPVHPKSPFTTYEDVETYVFNESEDIIKNHFKGKWTLKTSKEDIIERLFKYYKATKTLTDKKRKIATTTKGVPIQSDANAPPPVPKVKVSTQNLPSISKQTLSTSTGNANVTPSCVADREQIPVPNFSSLFKSSNVPKLNSDPDELRSTFVTPHTTYRNHQVAMNQPTYSSIEKPTAGPTDDIPPPVSQVFQFSVSQAPKFQTTQFNKQLDAIPAATTTTQNPFEVISEKIPKVFGEKSIIGCSIDGPQLPMSQTFSLVKPSNLEFFKFGPGRTAVETATTGAPPLLNLFPVQKLFSTDWNDKMMASDYTESNNDLFPTDWAAEIVMDQQGQEWLQTLGNDGRTVYINLTSGASSYDISHLYGSLRKVTVGEMKKSNPARYNWLRRHFPRGFRKFWNGDSREIVKNGDLTKLNDSVIGISLLKCINQQNPDDQLSKWTDDELQNVSKYFSDSKDSSIKTINSVTASGIQCWKNLGGTTSSFRLSREDFEMIRVIGQYDRKFILAGIRKSVTENETLVIFDQHAVHERIRLEQLMADSVKNSKAAIKYLIGSDVIPSYQLPLSETEVRIMQNYVECFSQVALKFEPVSSTAVKIKSVPKCFIEKCSNEAAASREETFRNLVHGLIQELIHTIMETKVARLSGLPKTVHAAICSQACHGAIKFGDVLDLDTCKQLILKLRSCKNLFQCAHGRPSVVPLIRGEDMLKVSAAGYNCLQDRQSCQLATNVCLPFHEECSSYFCKPDEADTSNYFSLFDASDLSKKDTDATCNDVPFNFSRANQSKDINTSATSDFFSFVFGEKALNEDEEESPYFFRVN